MGPAPKHAPGSRALTHRWRSVQRRSRNVRSCSPLLPRCRRHPGHPSPTPQPYRSCLYQRARTKGERGCCQASLPCRLLQVNLNFQPPKSGHVIYNTFDILLFSPNNSCSKFEPKAYFALPDDLRLSHDLLHCYHH